MRLQPVAATFIISWDLARVQPRFHARSRTPDDFVLVVRFLNMASSHDRPTDRPIRQRRCIGMASERVRAELKSGSAESTARTVKGAIFRELAVPC